jgi:hypothetical protein
LIHGRNGERYKKSLFLKDGQCDDVRWGTFVEDWIERVVGAKRERECEAEIEILRKL